MGEGLGCSSKSGVWAEPIQPDILWVLYEEIRIKQLTDPRGNVSASCQVAHHCYMLSGPPYSIEIWGGTG